MDKEKIYKTIEIVVKAIVAIAAVWLCVSCTMSLSVSKHNTNSHQNTEQSQATSVDSRKTFSNAYSPDGNKIPQ